MLYVIIGMVIALSREIAVKFSYTIEHVLGYNICHYLGYGVVCLSIIIRCISTLVVKKLEENNLLVVKYKATSVCKCMYAKFNLLWG